MAKRNKWDRNPATKPQFVIMNEEAQFFAFFDRNQIMWTSIAETRFSTQSAAEKQIVAMRNAGWLIGDLEIIRY